MKPALSKKLLRSLPTLTEVVDAPPSPAAPMRAVMTPGGDIDEEALVERVLQRLGPVLEARIQAEVQAQVKELGPRIRQRVDSAVRKALTQMTTVEDEPKAPGAGSR